MSLGVLWGLFISAFVAASVFPAQSELFLAGALVSVALTLLVTGVIGGPPAFDEEALERDVTSVVQNDFDVADFRRVDCPSGLTAEPGLEFECTFTSGGVELSVPVEVLNDAGQYRVGGPTE